MIRRHELNDDDYDFFENIQAELAAADDMEINIRMRETDDQLDILEKEFWRKR